MPASEYVGSYLRLWTWVNETYTLTRVRNYLQSGKGSQSARALKVYGDLLAKLPKRAGLPAGAILPAVFTVDGFKFVSTSIWRAFNGKGAPDEIQDALWLASLCGLVDPSTLTAYCDNNLGIDCGGFVANYWGMGRPSESSPNPQGATGYLPRTIWSLYPALRRKSASEIQPDDAAVFFEDVLHDDPNIAAHKIGNAYDRSSGSQAFHIGLVSDITQIAGTDQVYIELAESSGAPASSGGNGVNVRALGPVKATVSKGLVWCPDGKNRVYFIGRQGAEPAYQGNLASV